MMKRLSTLNEKEPTAVEQNQHSREGEHSAISITKDMQPKPHEVITVSQLKDLIKETIRDMVESVVQPPKLQQFDGKGNQRQYITHFVETCNNSDTFDDLMVKQFVLFLKGNAFNWYTDLESSTINSWKQLKHEFFNHFYSTRRILSMIELTVAR